MSITMDLLGRFNRNKPTSQSSIDSFQEKTGIALPPSYVEFLHISNGGEGFIGENSYLILWPIEQVRELNIAYEVDQYAPGLLLFGSNGGGEAFAFHVREDGLPIVQVPFVGMDLEYADIVASDFLDFLKILNEA